VKTKNLYLLVAIAILLSFGFVNKSFSQDQKQMTPQSTQTAQTTQTTQTTQVSNTSSPSSTIIGEVIDVNCYLADGKEGTGPDHKTCAEMCAKAGVPLGILTSDGNIYYPIAPMGKSPNDKLMDYIAKQVQVSGEVFKQGNNYGIKIVSIQEMK
jgi:hypothetical protein